MFKRVQKDVTAEMLARYKAKCEAALARGELVPLPSRFEGLALKGIPVVITERVEV